MNPAPPLAFDTSSADQPTAFRAKLGQSDPSLGARQRRSERKPNARSHRGRRLAALLAAIAVPAMAAPSDWKGFQIGGEPTELVQETQPMPFEVGGQSFPGSAFYYLEDTPELALDYEADFDLADAVGGLDAESITDTDVTGFVGPAARGFRSLGSGIDKARALQCLAMAVHYEAASESIDGQRAVAQVVLNRVSHPSYPNSVCGVVFQGSERRTGCQFSFTCDGSLGRIPARSSWLRAQGVSQRALSGEVYAGVGTATHYHTTAIYPYWAPSLNHITTIGAHRFYRWHGAAGQPAAFRSAYRGNEPMAGPKPRSTTDAAAEAATNPVSLARAYEEAREKAVAEARRTQAAPVRAAAPTYNRAVQQSGGDAQFTAQNLPEETGVRDEFKNSGRWLREPGGGPISAPTSADR